MQKVKYSKKDPFVSFTEKELYVFGDYSNVSIIKGKGFILKGSKEHECDCDRCDCDYEEVEEFFTTKEEAEKYAEDYDVEIDSIEEDVFFVKALTQKPVNFGLFKGE